MFVHFHFLIFCWLSASSCHFESVSFSLIHPAKTMLLFQVWVNQTHIHLLPTGSTSSCGSSKAWHNAAEHSSFLLTFPRKACFGLAHVMFPEFKGTRQEHQNLPSPLFQTCRTHWQHAHFRSEQKHASQPDDRPSAKKYPGWTHTHSNATKMLPGLGLPPHKLTNATVLCYTPRFPTEANIELSKAVSHGTGIRRFQLVDMVRRTIPDGNVILPSTSLTARLVRRANLNTVHCFIDSWKWRHDDN